MNASGSNWDIGVEFTKTLTFSSPGIVEYYFEAETNGGVTLRYPETGYLELNIGESVAGWEVDVSSVNASPNYLENGGNFSVTAGVHNNSNSPDKIYNNLSYTFQLLSPTGNILDTRTGTISTITRYQTVQVNENFSLGSTEGSYRINFTVNPIKDNNWANNSGSDIIIVGEEGPSHQFYISSDEAWVQLGLPPYEQCHPFQGDTYCITYISSPSIEVRQNGGSPKTIYYKDFREFNSDQVALFYQGRLGTESAFISFGVQNTGYVTFPQTEITCFPGDNIVFEANCSQNEFSTDNPDFYDNSYIDDWFDDVDVSNNDHTAHYEFDVPSSATLGEHDFYIGCELSDGSQSFVRQLIINVVAPPPNISSLETNTFSADDILTISGSNFNTTGTVKFGAVEATTIVSWTSTSITCEVPEGIQGANLLVTTSGGVSNGMPYRVISSTGDPEVVQPVPNQSMNGGATLLAADFNNVFWDRSVSA